MMRREVFVITAILLTMGMCSAEQSSSKPSSVELTVYNQNFALVKEERAMTLELGINFISVQDVAARIEPSSVHFKSKTDAASVIVREQNYQYDLLNPRTVLDKSIGKRVKVRRFSDGTIHETEGTILSTADNSLVLQTATGVVLNPGGEIEITEIPDGLVSRPTLVWKLETNKPGNHVTQVSYLTNEITWIADYVSVVDPLERFIDITGWVTLDNKSGATYENAKLNLIAGDVRRIQPEVLDKGLPARASVAYEMDRVQFEDRSFFEYHMYTLRDKTTVRDRESKQVTLMTANRVPVEKQFIYEGARHNKVKVILETKNSTENNLGIPLPKGRVRVYKQETDANQHFIGEDMIDHTPRNEKVRLYIGDAFDIVGERAQMSTRRISDREREDSIEIKIRNHKDLPVTVTIVEKIWGDWRMIQNSHKFEKKDATTIEIPVEVPKDGETVVTYTYRTRW